MQTALNEMRELDFSKRKVSDRRLEERRTVNRREDAAKFVEWMDRHHGNWRPWSKSIQQDARRLFDSLHQEGLLTCGAGPSATPDKMDA